MIILNEFAEPAGDHESVSGVYIADEFDPSAEYRIEVPTLPFGLADGQSGGEGLIRLPVRSVGRIEGRYYFSTDLRFVAYPGAVCVLPTRLIVSTDVNYVGGGWRGSLSICGLPVFWTTTQATRDQVVEQLAGWAARQPADVFEIPGPLRDMLKSFAVDGGGIVTTVDANGVADLVEDDRSESDSAMDDAFGTGA